MKFTTPLFAAAATLVAGAAAELYITLPDEDTVWVSGQPGQIAWNTSATEFGLSCDIQLIDVATTEAVMNITNHSIPCSINQFTTAPLPVMENEEFMVRIGETNNRTIWSYTQNFKIVKGAQNDGNATIVLANSTATNQTTEAVEEDKKDKKKKHKKNKHHHHHHHEEDEE
ncbi:hypothetical protein BDF20DRAFT_913524 [Mycotypha africana]|uniref:uncharacterized protein n=1 Tax=Mycotypha africana TaxID=64632 RepID=UPI00230170B3|nr:uncharacterized protein BDF20DRAFT_913524 [Mycotypha africana]KAI8977160.1 hypothetical protein BDF20DRAFT_913524 [Mycotypha africana]